MYKKQPSIRYSESAYNDTFVFRCMKAIIPLLDHPHSYFFPGEEELQAMTKRLSRMTREIDHRKHYKADGVIKNAKFKDLEVLLVETAGPFGKTDNRKTSFDNVKGMFALLSMLKTIADQYFLGSVNTFQKLKLYYLQPSGNL